MEIPSRFLQRPVIWAFGVEVMLFARHELLSVLPERMHKAVWRDLSSVKIYEHHALERVLGSDAVGGVIWQNKN